MKKCTTCKTKKPRESFARHSKSKDGLQGQCRQCRRQYYLDNRARCKEHMRTYNSTPERKARHAVVSRAATLQRKYGITVQEYDAMLADQGGRCAICGRTDSGSAATKYLAVDHCHSTGKVRGILCDPCNRGIGLLQDAVETVEAAAKYLRRNK
jgi:hypothetical protein